MTAMLPARRMDLSTVVVVIVVLQAATVLTIVALAARHGAPRAWPRAAWACSAGGAGLAAFVIWWINKPVEGATLFLVSSDHGVAVGDLLAVPFLATATALVAARCRPGKR
jgi:uncharacterized membrane protein